MGSFSTALCHGHYPPIRLPKRGVCDRKEGKATILGDDCILHEKWKWKRDEEAEKRGVEEDWHHMESKLEEYGKKEDFTHYRLTITTTLAALSSAPVLLLAPSAQPFCKVDLLLLIAAYTTAAAISKITQSWISRPSGHYIAFLMALTPILSQMTLAPFDSTDSYLIPTVAYIVVGAFLAMHEK